MNVNNVWESFLQTRDKSRYYSCELSTAAKGGHSHYSPSKKCYSFGKRSKWVSEIVILRGNITLYNVTIISLQ